MFTIDLTLKLSPIPISVQRKEKSDAEALYDSILTTLKGDTPEIIELTCEKQTDKKVAVFSDQISAVILSEKAGTSPSGRMAGFINVSEEDK